MDSRRWSWWEVLLWAYSTIYVVFLIFVFILGAVAPSPASPGSQTALIVFMVLSLPVLAFLILEGVKHLREHKSKEVMESVPDDKEKLKRRRNKVLAWVFLVEVLLTLLEIPTLRSSPSLIHAIATWLDFAFDVPFIYFIVQMFRQKNVLKPLFYVALADSILSVIFIFLFRNGDYNAVAINVLLALFFAYYIKASLTRKNSRISYFVLLPIFVLYSLGVIAYGAYQTVQINNEQQMVTNAFLNFMKGQPAEQAAFTTLVTDQDPNKLHQDVLNLQSLNNGQLQQIESLENMITAAEASTTNQLALDSYGKLFVYVDALKNQDTVLNELVTYDLPINYNQITTEQGATNRTYINQINNMEPDIIDKFQTLEGDGPSNSSSSSSD